MGTETSEQDMSVLGHVVGGTCDTDFDTHGGFVLWAFMILYCFYLLARLCDDHLTRCLEQIVERLGIPEDVAGATFLAMSSSAPELFHSIVATFVLVSPSGVGNIVGSALFNLLCILGVLPVMAKSGKLHIWWYPTMRDACFYMLAVVELAIVIWDGRIYTGEAAFLTATYACYVTFFFFNSRIVEYFGLEPVADAEDTDAECQGKADGEGGQEDKQSHHRAAAANEECKASAPHVTFHSREVAVTRGSTAAQRPCIPCFGNLMGALMGPSCSAFFAGVVPDGGSDPRDEEVPPSELRGAGRPDPASTVNAPVATIKGARSPDDAQDAKDIIGTAAEANEETDEDDDGPPTCPTEPFMWLVGQSTPVTKEWVLAAFAVVVLWIGGFTYVMVDASGRLGCLAKVPHVVMGLVVLAAGTSVPDMIGSIAVARKGQADMAAANAVGSNTFDILLGLGLPWLIRCLWKGPIDVPSSQLLECVAILACCIIGYVSAMIFNKWVLTRQIGISLLVVYGCSVGIILFRHYTAYAVH